MVREAVAIKAAMYSEGLREKGRSVRTTVCSACTSEGVFYGMFHRIGYPDGERR